MSQEMMVDMTITDTAAAGVKMAATTTARMTSASAPLPPGSWLGLLGGGQLGRMFIQAAQQMGYKVVLLAPEMYSPASTVADRHICADYDDPLALAELADLAQAITTEFESVPAPSLTFLAARTRVAPGAQALAIAQNRIQEKTFFDFHAAQSGVLPVPWCGLRQAADLAAVPSSMFPGVLKTAQFGYDGKGQITVANRADLPAAWRELGEQPCVLEQWLPLAFEISIVVARADDGQTVLYPVAQNQHRKGILHISQVPAPSASHDLIQRAQRAALHWSAALEYVGVLCFEFFVLQDGSLLINEMAPRPHNSGHYSLDACQVSQFEQQVRALAQLPLLTPQLKSPVTMLNLMGDLWAQGTPDFSAVQALAGAHLHLYGKHQARAGRKMGHINLLDADLSLAHAKLDALAGKLAGAVMLADVD
jgi:5-(carboxyamino)imidazole ribonucleotide synthase